MIPDFETWYEQLTDNDIWFDTMKVQHGGAGRIREAAQLVYGDYVGNPKMFPAPEAARSHIHYKLARMPRRVETNYQHEKKEDDFSNPLTEEQKKVIDKLLEDYKWQIANDFKVTSIFDIENPEKEGAERMPLGTGYRFDPDKAARDKEEHDRKLKEFRYKTLREKYPELSPKEIYQRIKQMKNN